MKTRYKMRENEEITMKFTLVNNEGCVMNTTMAKSFREARKNLKDFYTGNYKIVCENDGEWKNVKL